MAASFALQQTWAVLLLVRALRFPTRYSLKVIAWLPRLFLKVLVQASMLRNSCILHDCRFSSMFCFWGIFQIQSLGSGMYVYVQLLWLVLHCAYLSVCLHTVLVSISVAVLKHHDGEEPGEERFWVILHFYIIDLHQELKTGSWRRGLREKPWREAAD